ncbi:recombinase family protein [Bradyrhizobium diazoefficiens]|uniref:recombinase family protein n=1 Tax=Bradyrhizobium diazoefficiens TaxID=1355477 RepID=UPI00190DCC6A|nr:recombinase family protein [Bradyrhizobium diazoefficiens]
MNEKYIGNIVYNRTSRKLGGEAVDNAPESWIRSEGCIDPIVDHDTFFKVKRIIEQRRVWRPLSLLGGTTSPPCQRIDCCHQAGGEQQLRT